MQRHRAAVGLQRNLKNKNQVNREANKSKNNNATFRGPAIAGKGCFRLLGAYWHHTKKLPRSLLWSIYKQICVPAIKLKSTQLSVRTNICCFGLAPLFRARHDIYLSSVKKQTNSRKVLLYSYVDQKRKFVSKLVWTIALHFFETFRGPALFGVSQCSAVTFSE